MTITLAPQVETRLRRKAARTGEDAGALADALLLCALADEASETEEAAETVLREEYRQLVAAELTARLSEAQAARLSEAQAARLRQVTQELDHLDAHSPAAQAMFLRLDETGHKLDEMLVLLRSLPVAQCSHVERLPCCDR